VLEQHLVRKFAIELLPVSFHPALRRQRHDGAAGNIDAGSAPVLVAVALLEKHQMAVGMCPAKKSRQIAVGGMRHCARGAEIGQRRDKQIAFGNQALRRFRCRNPDVRSRINGDDLGSTPTRMTIIAFSSRSRNSMLNGLQTYTTP
jgi:hypothetical protein